jgi:hypothetical protein
MPSYHAKETATFLTNSIRYAVSFMPMALEEPRPLNREERRFLSTLPLALPTRGL